MAKSNSKSKSDIKTCTIYVDGMHCASCEVLIEKKLLKMEGVQSVDASMKDNVVEVAFEGNTPPISALNDEFKSQGYHFSTHKIPKSKSKPLFSFKDGQVEINSEKARSWFEISLTAFAVLIIFLAIGKLQLGNIANVDSNSSFGAFFVLGVVAGVSSCAALVGGLLLSMTKQWNEVYIDQESDLKRASPHIMFHIGRIVSFVVLGGLLGLVGGVVGEVFSINQTVSALLVMIVSVVMLLLALQMMGVGWAQRFRFAAPKSLTRFTADENNFTGKLMPFAVGAMTFVLPCGFTLIAQTIAFTSGSFITGAGIMLAFVLGTLPILLGISFTGVKLTANPRLTARFGQVAGVIIFFFVLYNLNSQLNVLGMSSFSDISFGSGNSVTASDEKVIENVDGLQVMKVTADEFEYTAQSGTTLKAGVPTVIEVNNLGVEGCGRAMAARGLFDGYVLLKPGINKIEFTPKAGSYKLTCSMGMVPPITIKVI